MKKLKFGIIRFVIIGLLFLSQGELIKAQIGTSGVNAVDDTIWISKIRPIDILVLSNDFVQLQNKPSVRLLSSAEYGDTEAVINNKIRYTPGENISLAEGEEYLELLKYELCDARTNECDTALIMIVWETPVDNTGTEFIQYQRILDPLVQNADSLRGVMAKELGWKMLRDCPCKNNLELWGNTDEIIWDGIIEEATNGNKQKGDTEDTDLDNDNGIHYNYLVGPYDLSNTGLTQINLERSSPSTTPTSVAIIDSGIEAGLEAFDALIKKNSRDECGTNLEVGYNLVDDSDVSDMDGHGTHVAGIVTMYENSGNPNMEIIPIKVVDTVSGSLFNAICGMRLAINKGVRLINLSLTQKGERNGVFEATVKMAEDAGIIIVCSAGNEGNAYPESPARSVSRAEPLAMNGLMKTQGKRKSLVDKSLYEKSYWPGAFSFGNIVNVAAVDYENKLCDFSNYSKTHVDIGAPGLNIESLAREGFTDNVKSGTSMATGFVTRELALLIARNPGWGHEQIIQELYDNAIETPDLAGKTSQGKRLGGILTYEKSSKSPGFNCWFIITLVLLLLLLLLWYWKRKPRS